jgi:glycosyltransferase involved in cell wall biosynthesis
MSWPPNIDASLYFVREVYPLIKSREPQARLVLAGSRPPASVTSLPERDPSIEVPGFVDDMHSLAAEAAVFIVPLRSGSGMRVKILNAMAMGLPVVSTSVGCEGIPAVDGRDALIADTAQDLAQAVTSLLASPNLRFRIAANGRKFVEENFDWQAIFPRLDETLEELAPQVGRGIST